MADQGSRPIVFVSSTIRDFVDLRGALKFWLEENDCEVWMSEYNDADKPPDAGTFEACFSAVRRAHFYLLLVGERMGGLYSEPDGVSITQQEYRVAYDAFRQDGHPIPALFVRRSVRDHIHGWNASGRSGAPPFADASFIDQFISEVTRSDEVNDAVRGIGPYPLGNWLYDFHDFRDIIDALRFVLGLKFDVSLQRVVSAMQLDIEVMLTSFIGRADVPGGWIADHLQDMLAALPEDRREQMVGQFAAATFDFPLPGHLYMQSIADKIQLDAKNREDIVLDKETKTRVGMYLMGGIVPPTNIWLAGLREASTSRALLRYDPHSKSLGETELSIAVVEAIQEAEMYATRYASFSGIQTQVIASIIDANTRGIAALVISWEHAVIIWGMYHSQVNLFRRFASIYACLKGAKASPMPDMLLPVSPLGRDMDEEIKRQHPSRSQVEQWCQVPGFWNF